MQPCRGSSTIRFYGWIGWGSAASDPAGNAGRSQTAKTGDPGYRGPMAGRMLRRQVSLGVVAWIVIGVIVAARKGFLDDLGSVSAVLSAILAVAVWPLVVLDVHFGV